MLLGGTRRRTPFEFDPGTANWLFHLNSNAYPVHVNTYRSILEVEY